MRQQIDSFFFKLFNHFLFCRDVVNSSNQLFYARKKKRKKSNKSRNVFVTSLLRFCRKKLFEFFFFEKPESLFFYTVDDIVNIAAKTLFLENCLAILRLTAQKHRLFYRLGSSFFIGYRKNKKKIIIKKKFF